MTEGHIETVWQVLSTELTQLRTRTLRAGRRSTASPLRGHAAMTDYLATLAAYTCAIPQMWRHYAASPTARSHKDLADMARLALRTSLGGALDVLGSRMLRPDGVLRDRLEVRAELIEATAFAGAEGPSIPRELMEALADDYVRVFAALGSVYDRRPGPRAAEVLPDAAVLMAAVLARIDSLPITENRGDQ